MQRIPESCYAGKETVDIQTVDKNYAIYQNNEITSLKKKEVE